MRVRDFLVLSVTAAATALIGLVGPGIAQASGSTVVATYVDHGKGGHGGMGVVGSIEGTLLADGTATGSGEVTITTPDGPFTFQVQAVGWMVVSPTTDGILTLTSFGASDCLLLPVGVAQPGPAYHTLTGDCSDPAAFIGTFGKVTPTD
jgi:hypothetical protein